MSHPVKWFTSDMTGAPAPATAAGTMISILDACLINGFNTQPLASLTYDSGTGQCTSAVSAGHGFTQYQVILIEGAVESGFNGEQRITALDSTTFKFTLTSTPAVATATGTITAKAAPLGWEKAFSGTNKAAYRSTDILSTQCYFRLDDSPGTGVSPVTCYKSMTDVDTGANQVGGGYWRITYRHGVASYWAVVGDNRGFYFYTTNYTYQCLVFVGDFISFVVADAYNFAFTHDTFSSPESYNSSGVIGKYNTSAGSYLARNHTGTLLNRSFSRHGITTGFTNHPDPIVSGIVAGSYLPIREESTDGWRGFMPGCRMCLTATSGVAGMLPGNFLFFSRDGLWRISISYRTARPMERINAL